jgi:hypothetical protein
LVFDRRIKNNPTNTAARAATGIRVDRNDEIEDEVPVLVLDPAFELDWELRLSAKLCN